MSKLALINVFMCCFTFGTPSANCYYIQYIMPLHKMYYFNSDLSFVIAMENTRKQI